MVQAALAVGCVPDILLSHWLLSHWVERMCREESLASSLSRGTTQVCIAARSRLGCLGQRKRHSSPLLRLCDAAAPDYQDGGRGITRHTTGLHCVPILQVTRLH